MWAITSAASVNQLSHTWQLVESTDRYLGWYVFDDGVITVGHEWDSTLRSKSGTAEPGMRLTRAQPTESGDQSDQSEHKQPFTVLDSFGDARWRRGWGLHAVGSSHVAPHFAIRVTDNSTTAHAECLVLGVSRVKSVDVSAAINGHDENCYVLFSSQRQIWRDPAPFPKRGIIAMAHYQQLSRLLVTTDQLKLVDANQKQMPAAEEDDTSGLMIRGKTRVIGVVCDLKDNTIRFYLNDQMLRVSRFQYSGLWADKAVDAKIAVGEPFCWRLPAEVKLSECYPYFCLSVAGVRAEFIEWTPPLPEIPLRE